MPTTPPAPTDLLPFTCGCGRTQVITRREAEKCRAAVDNDLIPPSATTEEYLALCDGMWAKGRYGLLCDHCTGVATG